jgi:3-deoxy-manno-octulosonate cytidylyltransferase (CMP-KDO synthetase)
LRTLWNTIQEIEHAPLSLPIFKHIGLYGYTRDFLLHFASLKPTQLEKIEHLEQLRALEHGYKIKVGITEKDSLGVDHPDDLHRVRDLVKQQGLSFNCS